MMGSGSAPGLVLVTLILVAVVVELEYKCTSTNININIGLNWGSRASHPLPPPQVVELLKSNNISRLRLLFDTNPSLLQLQPLSHHIDSFIVGIPDVMLPKLNSSLKAASTWVHDNLTRHLNNALRIRYVAVGEEPFLSTNGDRFHPFLMGAVSNLQTSLEKADLATKVKIVVPCSHDAFLSESGLPSKGHFRNDVNSTMTQLLSFLSEHRSPFFATISPFLTLQQSKNFSLDFALFRETAHPCNDTHRMYKNMFDLSYDTLVSALYGAGFAEMDIIVAQIGWPTDGAPNASALLAQEFMKGLMAHLRRKSGTPLRPHNPPKEVYIFSLLDEDQRSTSLGNFERHWGLFSFDGQAKYDVDVGQGSRKLVNVQNAEYLPSRWCVVDNNKDLSNASANVLEACSVADCSVLSHGSSCSNISWPGNISYAFNSYFQLHDQRADSCYFGGLGLITKNDPSVGTCRFSIALRTSHAPSCIPSYLLQLIYLLVTTILIMSGGP